MGSSRPFLPVVVVIIVVAVSATTATVNVPVTDMVFAACRGAR
jgi:hypothetical protein